jgi:2-aminobenzoate-CoA ligase
MNHYHDNFAHDKLPALKLQPEYLFDHPDFEFPENLNCVAPLLDIHIKEGRGNQIAIRTFDSVWTYQDLYNKANQIANYLIDDTGFVSGNRVLIRSANNPMFVASWFAVLKAGGIVVATMPLLREKELSVMIESAQISHAFCDYRLRDEMDLVTEPALKKVIYFDGSEQSDQELEKAIAEKSIQFENYPTRSDSISLIGFTSGTTGKPKMTAHFHRDVILICEAFPKYSLQPKPDDV